MPVNDSLTSQLQSHVVSIEMGREHLVVWSAVGVSDDTLYVLIDHLWDLVLPVILMRMSDWSEP